VFIPDRACYGFVTELEEVAAGIGKLAGADPVRATALYETFLAGCYEKAEELDDSSGSFGQFAGELICGWIKARQASGAEADETAAILLARMDDDPYGFCYQIEKDAAKAFDKAGLAAFERQIQARFEAAATAKPAPGKALGHDPEYLLRHWSELLRTIYLAQKNLAAYIVLTTQTGVTAGDCYAVATMLTKRGHARQLPRRDAGARCPCRRPPRPSAARASPSPRPPRRPLLEARTALSGVDGARVAMSLQHR
jgi:hypothetical protein